MKPANPSPQLHPNQRLVMTYDAGETPCGPADAEAQIRSLVRCFEGTHVGILQRHIGAIKAYQQSEVLEINDVQAPWLEAGVDPMTVFVDECHRCGMEAWGSRRMGDAHHTYEILEYEKSQSQFYKDHPELRLKWKRDVQVAPKYDWNKPEIAAQNLAFLREVAEGYGVDGIDLDFTRIPPWFNEGEEAQGRETMNQHLRDLRAMLDEVGDRKGKRLGLSVQLYHRDSLWKAERSDLRHEGTRNKSMDLETEQDDITAHFDAGLDVRSWVNEGLIDLLNAHSRNTSLYEMDISAWKQAVAGSSCRLVAGPGKPGFFVERRGGFVDGYPAHLTRPLEHRAVAHRLYLQGADGLAFYDYVIRFFELQWDVFRELGDPERLRGANKTYVFQLFLPLDLGMRDEGRTTWMPIDLPEDLGSARASGDSVDVRLLLNVSELVTPEDLLLRVNDEDIPVRRERDVTTPLATTDHPGDTPGCHLETTVPCEILRRARNELAFTVRAAAVRPAGVHPQPCVLHKVHLEVTYRDETYPYWLAMQLDQRRL